MSAFVETYKCEVCSGVLLNLDADCPYCEPDKPIEFVDLSSSQFVAKFEREPLPSAFLALARNALVGESFVAAGNVGPVIVTSAGQSLEQDGCDFIRAVFLVLEYMECPPSVRDFVLCIAGITGGAAEQWFKITDGQIADHMGYTRTYIGEKRKELIAWEQSIDHAVIEIKQQERDPVTKHYGITEYRAPIITLAALFINRARAVSHARSKNANLALKDATAKGLNEHVPQYGISEVSDDESRQIINELKDDLPTVPLAQKRFGRSRNVTPPGSSLTRYNDHEERAVKSVLECMTHAPTLMGIEPDEAITRILEKVQKRRTV